jgi:hypothetical protein
VLCKDCQSEMWEGEAPHPVFRFWKFELWIYGPVSACVECEQDKQAYKEQRIFDAGTEHGWDEAHRTSNGVFGR